MTSYSRKIKLPPLFLTLLALCISLSTPLISGASELIYTIQAASFLQKNRALQHVTDLGRRLDAGNRTYLRIEKIKAYYTIRLGQFNTYKEANSALEYLALQLPGALIIQSSINEKHVVLMYSDEEVYGEEVSNGIANGAGILPASSEVLSGRMDMRNSIRQSPRIDQAHSARQLTYRPDDKRPEDQLSITLFGKPLTIGGEYAVSTAYRKDFELEDDAEDDTWSLNQELEIEMLHELRDNVALFVELKPFYNAEIYAEDGDRSADRFDVKRGETWVYWDTVFNSPLRVQVGSQNFDDKREWWWDEDLDALSIHYDKDKWHLHFAVAEELAPRSTDEVFIDPEDDDILRLLANLTWRRAKKQRAEVFFLHEHDHSHTESENDIIKRDRRDRSDADLTWIGARMLGRWKYRPLGRFHYWLDTAIVWGEESVIDYDSIDSEKSVVDSVDMIDVRGTAIDAGVTWQTRWEWLQNVTLGYAFGTGDSDPDDKTDRAFRQTGLQDNSAKFRGVNSFKYYGELLEPELSNLHILTVSLGFRFLENSSLEFLYHRYRQDKKADYLRDASIKVDPLGEDRDIGQEWDVVIGIEEWKHVELEMIGSLFRAGDAFGPLSGETASYVKFEFTYNF